MVAVQIEEAMKQIERMLAHKVSFEETIAAIDECAAMPGAEPTYMPGLQSYRLMAMDIHGRPDSELCAALDAFNAIEPSLPNRALSVTAACAHRAVVASKYLPPLIAELEAAIARSPDKPLELALRDTRAVCERLGIPVDDTPPESDPAANTSNGG